MTSPSDPHVWQLPGVVEWSVLLLDSFARWTGRELVARDGNPEAQARALFEAPFVLISHGPELDPILNYGNRAALQLWEMPWDEFIGTPSRLTAEPLQQADRDRVLAEVAAHGFLNGYSAVRVSARGRRFRIEDTILCNVIDTDGCRVGQAASFSRWCCLG